LEFSDFGLGVRDEDSGPGVKDLKLRVYGVGLKG
jgi:hypothetical protein